MQTTRSTRIRRRPIILAVLLTLLTAGLVTVGARTALADTGWTYLCGGPGQSSCATLGYTDHGYSGHSGTSYWNEATGVECTNYAAYVEQTVNGAPATISPDTGLGNAYQWNSTAATDGFTVNGTPDVGAVAQWGIDDGPALGDGHVAYVESVSYSGGSVASITISSDNDPSGGFSWATITAGGSYWPDNFIHFAGTSSSTTSELPTTALSSGGEMSAYARSSSNTLLTWWQSTAGGLWNGPQPLVTGTTITDSPSAVVEPSGIQVVYAAVRAETWSPTGKPRPVAVPGTRLHSVAALSAPRWRLIRHLGTIRCLLVARLTHCSHGGRIPVGGTVL